jgi:hypothetical protein
MTKLTNPTTTSESEISRHEPQDLGSQVDRLFRDFRDGF